MFKLTRLPKTATITWPNSAKILLHSALILYQQTMEKAHFVECNPCCAVRARRKTSLRASNLLYTLNTNSAGN